MKTYYRLFRMGSRVGGNYQIATTDKDGEWEAPAAGPWKLGHKDQALKRMAEIVEEDKAEGRDAVALAGTGSY